MSRYSRRILEAYLWSYIDGEIEEAFFQNVVVGCAVECLKHNENMELLKDLIPDHMMFTIFAGIDYIVLHYLYLSIDQLKLMYAKPYLDENSIPSNHQKSIAQARFVDIEKCKIILPYHVLVDYELIEPYLYKVITEGSKALRTNTYDATYIFNQKSLDYLKKNCIYHCWYNEFYFESEEDWLKHIIAAEQISGYNEITKNIIELEEKYSHLKHEFKAMFRDDILTYVAIFKNFAKKSVIFNENFEDFKREITEVLG